MMCGPDSALKIAVMKEVIAETGNATNVAANELANAVSIIGTEDDVASALMNYATMENGVARESMGGAIIPATGSKASSDMMGEGLRVATDTVGVSTDAMSDGSMTGAA